MQRGLHQLVDTRFCRKRGLPPQALYTFKHALIQDTAYQSLLKSTRQQYHQRIAQCWRRISEIADSQPELLAHHYTRRALLPKPSRIGNAPGGRPCSGPPMRKR